MKRKELILAIEEYLDSRYELPGNYYTSNQSIFYQRSYNNWACSELVCYLKLHEDQPTIDAVMDFRDMMDDFCLKNRHTSYIFSTAYDVASDVLDLLLSIVSWRNEDV